MNLTFSVIFAAIYGLCLRLLFGVLGPGWEIMSVTFLALTPSIIGFITVILVPADRIRNLSAAFFMPWITTLVILVITIAFSVEGAICWIMIYPFFSVLAGLGGIAAYYAKNRLKKNGQDNTLNLSLVMMLPLLMGVIEKDNVAKKQEYASSASVIIDAQPDEVWQALTQTGNTPSGQHHFSLTTAIGFPEHVNTVMDTLVVGGKRMAYYQKGLYFDETIKSYQTNTSLVLAVKTYPEKISPTVMDEHILIGGKHLAILEDSYQIERLGAAKCRLTLSSKYVICTPINWYSAIWADILMRDILKAELADVKSKAML